MEGSLHDHYIGRNGKMEEGCSNGGKENPATMPSGSHHNFSFHFSAEKQYWGQSASLGVKGPWEINDVALWRKAASRQCGM